MKLNVKMNNYKNTEVQLIKVNYYPVREKVKQQ